MKYDVVIVGAGAAGCALAARLTEDSKRSVLLLEAGRDYPEFHRLPPELKNGFSSTASAFDSPHAWAYLADGAPGQSTPMPVVRGKVVGGSSAVNAQVFLRGLPEDYDSWAALGNDEWSYLKVLPYFRKLEADSDIYDDFHGNDGPVPVRREKREKWQPWQRAFYEACLAAGFPENSDMNHPDASGVGPVPLNNSNGIRMSGALTYLDPARHRLNLTVRGDAAVKRVLFDGSKAAGVEVESGGQQFTVEGREIVLAAGAIASPQLLMLSGVGPADRLSALGIPVVEDLPGVGRNLRDHPVLIIDLRVKDGVKLDTDGPRLQAGLRYTADGSESRNDMQIFPTNYGGPKSGDPIGDRMKSWDAEEVGVRLTCELMLGRSAGELRLASRDPAVAPELDYRYLVDPWDRKRLRGAVRTCQRLLRHPSFEPIVDGWLDPDERDLATDESLDAWMVQNLRTAYHTCGTCKMGPESDPMAVVDQYCRVRGLNGLRVVDLSVAPQVVRANTHATAIMIAERAAGWFQ